MNGLSARRHKRNSAQETQLGEAPFDATRVARFLRAPDGALRVALVNTTTGAEFGSLPLADRSREELARVMGIVTAMRDKLAAPRPATAEALAEVSTLDDARVIDLSRSTRHPGLATAAHEVLAQRIAAARQEVAGLENDRLRGAWEKAFSDRSPHAWTRLKAIEAEGEARGAKNPHDLLNQPRATPVEVRHEQIAYEVERTIAEARAQMAGARAFVGERSQFEELLPRESGIRSAYTSANDLEREYLPMAQAALAYAQSLPRKDAPPDPVAPLLARVQVVYDAAVDEYPPEAFDGAVTTAEVLAGLPSYEELAALVREGNAAEAERRVTVAEARLYAARRGIDLATLPSDAALAPPGSFASFVRVRPIPFRARFGSGAVESPADSAAELRRALAHVNARLADVTKSLKAVPHLQRGRLQYRLPSIYDIRKATTTKEALGHLKRVEAVAAEARDLAAKYTPTPLTTFDAIGRWYSQELPSGYKVVPAEDFHDVVTIDRGQYAPPVLLTVDAVRSLPIGRLLGNRWVIAEIERTVLAGLDDAIRQARKRGTDAAQALPVTVKFRGLDEPVNLVARFDGTRIVLDVRPLRWAGAPEALRPRAPTAYDRTRRYGLVSRPAGPGAVPDGYLSVEGQDGRDPFPWGIVTYPAPLRRKELYRFEMRPVWDRPEDALEAVFEDQPNAGPDDRDYWLRGARETWESGHHDGDVLAFGADVVRDLARSAMDHTRVWPLGQYDPRVVAPAFLALAGIEVPKPPPPLFGDLSYDESSRYFGTVVEVAPAGRGYPGWNATVFDVLNQGQLVSVSHPSWDGRWSGNVEKATIETSRIAKVLEWHDEKGERGPRFDPYVGRDMPESRVADNRVAQWREYLRTDLRAAPPSPVAIVNYDGSGHLTVAMGDPDPKRLPHSHTELDAVMAGYAVVFPDSERSGTLAQVRRYAREVVTTHAGGYWRSAGVDMPLIRDPERYREGALAAAERLASDIVDGGRGERYRVMLAGPPYSDAGATFTPYRSVRRRAADALIALGRPADDAWYEAEALEKAIVRGWWHDNFTPRPENKATRQAFTRLTGQKLPATLKGTKEILNGRTSFKIAEGA